MERSGRHSWEMVGSAGVGCWMCWERERTKLRVALAWQTQWDYSLSEGTQEEEQMCWQRAHFGHSVNLSVQLRSDSGWGHQTRCGLMTRAQYWSQKLFCFYCPYDLGQITWAPYLCFIEYKLVMVLNPPDRLLLGLNYIYAKCPAPWLAPTWYFNKPQVFWNTVYTA